MYKFISVLRYFRIGGGESEHVRASSVKIGVCQFL